MAGIEAQEQEVVDHFTAYEDASVKYLVAPALVDLLPALAKLGVTQVFADSIVAIYEMPNPALLLDDVNLVHRARARSDNAATVTCPSGASTLVRTELSMAGWHASVNGKPVTITTSDGAYQSIPVPRARRPSRSASCPPTRSTRS